MPQDPRGTPAYPVKRERDLGKLVVNTFAKSLRRKWRELEDKRNPTSHLKTYDDIVGEIFDTDMPEDANLLQRISHGVSNNLTKNWLRGKFARQYVVELDGDYDQRSMRELSRKLREMFPFPIRTDATFGIMRKAFSFGVWACTLGNVNFRAGEIRYASIDGNKLVFIVGNGTIMPHNIKFSHDLPKEFQAVIKLLQKVKSKTEKNKNQGLKLLGVKEKKGDTSSNLHDLIARSNDPAMQAALEELKELEKKAKDS